VRGGGAPVAGVAPGAGRAVAGAAGGAVPGGGAAPAVAAPAAGEPGFEAVWAETNTGVQCG